MGWFFISDGDFSLKKMKLLVSLREKFSLKN